jgi:hypothetical protein
LPPMLEGPVLQLRCHRRRPADVPPLKWSILRYGFWKEGYDEEEAYGPRDCREAATG